MKSKTFTIALIGLIAVGSFTLLASGIYLYTGKKHTDTRNQPAHRHTAGYTLPSLVPIVKVLR
jgi:uncharacterized iron-regulated membrane protein